MGKKVMFNPSTSEQKRRIFWLCGKIGIDLQDASVRGSIIREWTEGRAQGMSDLQFIDAMNIIKYLESTMRSCQRPKADTNSEEMNRKRKGLIKAVFRWLELQGKTPSMSYVKGVICRAGSVGNINELSAEALSRLYAEFCRKQSAGEVMNEEKELHFSVN
jgi:hypothetical protein